MTFQLPTYTEQGQAKLEYFKANARKLYDFLRAKQQNEPGYQHDNGKWAHIFRPRADENVCATPVCALGWAIHEGMCPGFDIRAFAHAQYLPAEAHVTHDEIHAARLTQPGSIDIAVDLAALPSNKGTLALLNMHVWKYDSAPVRDGVIHDWSAVGIEFFGKAVYNAVFRIAELELDSVLNYLESFAENGWIDACAESVDDYLPVTHTVRYFLTADMGAGTYFYNCDGSEGDTPPPLEEDE